jgi:hypothetical protein
MEVRCMTWNGRRMLDDLKKQDHSRCRVINHKLKKEAIAARLAKDSCMILVYTYTLKLYN